MRSQIFGAAAVCVLVALPQIVFAQDPELSAQQTAAYNSAIAEFTDGQKAQQAGDNAAALLKYEIALPAIRDVVRTQPDNVANIKFLANVLYVAAVAKATSQSFDLAIPLLEESVPHWRKAVENDKTDMQGQTLLTSILTQLGNAKLAKADKVGAAPLYAEAVTRAREAVGASATPENKNLLLGALIGASQTSDEASLKTEASRLSKSMIAEGSVNAANMPAAKVLAAQAS